MASNGQMILESLTELRLWMRDVTAAQGGGTLDQHAEQSPWLNLAR